MLGVEGVVGSCATTTTTFPVSVTTPIASTAAPAVVAGVGLIPLVAPAPGEGDPRSLLVPVVPSLSGSNPVTINTGTTASTPAMASPNNNTNNNNNTSINSNNPAAMEEEFVKPILKDGEMILEVECGQNKAAMYLSKLCQGSKGPCINFQGSWLTPNEFQFVSGRETAKDWKRSIRHHGKSLKLLLAKGILAVHPTMCDCEGCRIGAVLTRKGEKRRIPNGERKRKSTGNAPENSGSGAFRAVANGVAAVKSQDGPSEPKRLALDPKSQEGGQSPLKESSMMNLPEVKDGAHLRLAEGQLADVTKMAIESRLQGPNPLMPLLSPGRVCDISNSVSMAAAITSPTREQKDVTPSKPSNDKPRHDSGNTPQNAGDSTVGEGAVVTDVKVLSSSGVAAASKTDKSVDRLAIYQAAVSAVKSGVVCNMNSSRSNSPTSKCDKNENQPGAVAATTTDKKQDVLSHKKESLELSSLPSNGEVKPKPAVISNVVSKAEPADLRTRTEAQGSKPVVNHSTTSLSQPSDHGSSLAHNGSSTLSPTKPLLSPSVSATAAISPAAPHSKPTPLTSTPKRSDKDERPRQPLPSSLSPVSQRKSSEASEHLTIRHPSPDRQPSAETGMKHSPLKPSKDNHQHHHSAEKAHKDRKHDSSTSSLSSDKERHERERHVSRDKDASFSRHTGDRETDKRRPEERSDKDRKSGSASATSSSKSEEPGYRGGEYKSGVGSRGEGVPVTPTSSSVPAPPPMTDPAAFSEYMRVLAAGHHGLVPPPSGLMPPMFPLRPPTDLAVSSGLMHPMHAAACGMFSTPSALLPKDPVLYPTTAGTLPTASYPYGAPGMTPLPLLPTQYPSAASTAMLDYSRPFPYLPWSGGLHLMSPNDAIAAAVAANSSAKRSREEMESAAADMNAKRLQLPMAAAYGAAASMAPIDYMAAYRGLAATPLSCGMESSMYDKNAEYMRSRLFAGSAVGSAAGSKGVQSPYLASLPEYYRNLYCCRCMENRPGDIRTWGVDEVVKLVSSLEGCSVYTEIFREQRVDGKILVLLTADHLMKSLGMKLGPAVTLTNRVAKLLLESTQASGCDTCSRLAAMVPAVQSASGY